MIFDIIVISIIAVSMVLGARSGFLYAFIHTVGWLLAIVMGFIWSPKVSLFLSEKTGLPDAINNAFYARFSQSFSNATAAAENLPSLLSSIIEKTGSRFISQIAEEMTELSVSILAFVFSALAVKLILWVLTEALSRKKNDGVAGLADGILGAATGAVRGFLIVFFALALLVPITGFLEPDTAASLMDSLSASYFACDLYNNNFLMLIVRDFLF